MKQNITISSGYIELVKQVREAQAAYFQAAIKARNGKSPELWSDKKDLLTQSKYLESKLDKWTAELLTTIHGSMTADEAIAQMRLELGEVRSEKAEVRKEAING